VLNLLGYPAGKADGAWGAQTASALRAFQADQGLEVWSYPSDQSIKALISEAEKKLGAPEEMLRDYLTSFPGASPSP
jgi:peptidoglycan hydrolase-like protein with peptidoglycan-binding domain